MCGLFWGCREQTKQDDDGVPPAPRSNGQGGRVIRLGDSEVRQLRYHGRWKDTIGVIVAH